MTLAVSSTASLAVPPEPTPSDTCAYSVYLLPAWAAPPEYRTVPPVPIENVAGFA